MEEVEDPEVARAAAVAHDVNLKPSPLAFGESEAEDLSSMHYLLQTSRDVMPLKKTKAADGISLQTNSSVTKTASLAAKSEVFDGLGRKVQDPKAFSVAAPPVGEVSVELESATTAPQTHESALDSDAVVGEVKSEVDENNLMDNRDAQKHSASAKVQGHPSMKVEEKVLPGGNLNAWWTSPLDVAVTWRGAKLQRPLLDSLLVLLVVGFLVVILLLLMVGAGRFGRWCLDFYRYSEEKSLREHIEGMHRSPGLEVVNQLIAGSVYDCAIMRPLSSKQLIRLEARVEEAASGFCLWTPLSQQACVRFNATVSCQTKRSSLPVPMSYQCSSIDFVISLLDAPHVRIEIEGRDLSTFDMSAGRMNAKRTFDSAARHWQEFAMTHQIGGKKQPVSRFRSEHSVLEFQETAIVLGTSITVVGELQRNAVGTLLLRPSVDDLAEKPAQLSQEAWMTSWESTDMKDTISLASIRGSLAACRKPWLGKVWVSDDPALLGASHKHAKYEPTETKSKTSRDCSAQLADGLVNLISSGGQ